MDYSGKVSGAIRHFWDVRLKQSHSQGGATGVKDTGNRPAVTGGRQLDGFTGLLSEILRDAGLPEASIHQRKTTLPGYFRPTKNWDLIVVVDQTLLATIEFKSHVGPSFGNNFNNRVEEALGNANDLLVAYREGAFKPSARPWLGWLMLLEETEKSLTPVRADEPHFGVLPEFSNTSYAARYEMFCERLLRERLYDGTCLLLSDRQKASTGVFREPNLELSFNRFAESLFAHAHAFGRRRRQ